MGLLAVLGEENEGAVPRCVSCAGLEAWRAAIPRGAAVSSQRDGQCRHGLAVTGDRYDRIGGHVLLLLENRGGPPRSMPSSDFDRASERKRPSGCPGHSVFSEAVRVRNGPGWSRYINNSSLITPRSLSISAGREAGVQIHVRKYVEQGVEMLVARLRVSSRLFPHP